MKKIFLLAGIAFLLCGCSNKTTICTSDNVKVEIITNGNNIKTITALYEYENSEVVTNMCPTMKKIAKVSEDVTCEGKIIKIENYEKNIIIDELTKDSIIKYFENQSFTCE